MEAQPLTMLDTHAAVFLWEGRDLWGPASRPLLESTRLAISPFVRLELHYLEESGKLVVPVDEILGGLASDCRVELLDEGLADLVSVAVNFTWTRDPFDRIITATASLRKAYLVTKDRLILAHYEHAVW